MKKKYYSVIGLETHLQLNTGKKIFCNCKNNYGDVPNTNICPICTGQPGTLPVFNKNVLLMGIKMAHALNCKINLFTRFDRKNYFYPDCPKNYQITQNDYPIGYDGEFHYYSEKKEYKINIERIHIEEDSAKLIHKEDSLNKESLIDYNRSGVPLLEIVTNPEFKDSKSTLAYLEFLKRTAEFLDISNCNMEEGSLRVDTNISITDESNTMPNYKVEIKNLNSFTAVRNAINYECKRQINELKKDRKMRDETRMWDTKNKETKLMRVKETAGDYRYFPEPDIPPILLNEKRVYEIREKLGITPNLAISYLINDYKLSLNGAYLVSNDINSYNYFIETSKHCVHYEKIVNWMIGDINYNLKKLGRSFSNILMTPEVFADIVNKIAADELTGKIFKGILPLLLEGVDYKKIIKEGNVSVLSNKSDLEKIIKNIIKENPSETRLYKNGKTNLIGFFMGKLMERTKGKANPSIAKKILKTKLDK
jgi:aspartyl-tRNA(Asn)/glutamyl-tRNA(Gln) amidotransferase subunit B